MARYRDAKCRLCRREGQKLFLKGARCFTDKCAIERRNYPPGQHGLNRGKPTAFGIQLREKQKAKRIYGVLESQFRKYFQWARPRRASPARISCACSSSGSTTSSIGSASRPPAVKVARW